MRILITGGAGFVGSSLARLYHEKYSNCEVVCFDNLRRRGSEINVAEFKKRGIRFIHGDIRCPSDFQDLDGQYDLFIEASAEPSVLAGVSGSPSYVLETNLGGTLNCLEFARKHTQRMIFLSTSRVYSIQPLRNIATYETDTRLEISSPQSLPGVSSLGIAEDFSTQSSRSFYGSSKLASELIIQEYAASYQYPVIINRCGVIAGAGQFGKVDQGIFTLWVLNHIFGKNLKYTGFGGTGKQVRDLFHPRDLFSLLELQCNQSASPAWMGDIFNVGGGRSISSSLQEYTSACRKITGKEVSISIDPTTNPVDIPLYITDSTKASQAFSWQPRVTVNEIVQDIHDWVLREKNVLQPILGY